MLSPISQEYHQLSGAIICFLLILEANTFAFALGVIVEAPAAIGVFKHLDLDMAELHFSLASRLFLLLRQHILLGASTISIRTVFELICFLDGLMLTTQ
jgi:hypothetical protein